MPDEPAWQKWLAMSRESLGAARSVEADAPRSAVSRFYYAAYQAITSLLHYRGLIPPVDREGWSHDDTPEIFAEQLKPLIDRGTRATLKADLVTLYTLRIEADYKASVVTDSETAGSARKMSGFVVQVAERLMSGGRNA